MAIVSVRQASPVWRTSRYTTRRPGASTLSLSADPRSSSRGAPSMRGRSSSRPRQASSGRITARSPSPNTGVAVPRSSSPAAAAPAPISVRRELARRIAGASGLSTGSVFRTPTAARSASAPCPSSSSTPTRMPRRMPCSCSIANATSRREPSRRSRFRVYSARPASADAMAIQRNSGRPRGSASHRAPPRTTAPMATSSAVSAAASRPPVASSARRRWRRSRSTSAKIVMGRRGW